jgi:hypothetical protein
MLREVRPRPDLPIHGPSLKSGKTLNDLGRTGAIYSQARSHLRAAIAMIGMKSPGLDGG